MYTCTDTNIQKIQHGLSEYVFTYDYLLNSFGFTKSSNTLKSLETIYFD